MQGFVPVIGDVAKLVKLVLFEIAVLGHLSRPGAGAWLACSAGQASLSHKDAYVTVLKASAYAGLLWHLLPRGRPFCGDLSSI